MPEVLRVARAPVFWEQSELGLVGHTVGGCGNPLPSQCLYLHHRAGFITMTPQLFINYKLKSVAHLPWRMLTYKALNTFIDDLFAFVIKMPVMYRIGCLRDGEAPGRLGTRASDHLHLWPREGALPHTICPRRRGVLYLPLPTVDLPR